jgi:hypothetical protein
MSSEANAAGFVFSENWQDNNSQPTGGVTSGRGFVISWQNGPLRVDGERREPNGAFVEDIITAAQNRLKYYQQSIFNCAENSEAVHHLEKALAVLRYRTAKREAKGIEGTYEI